MMTQTLTLTNDCYDWFQSLRRQTHPVTKKRVLFSENELMIRICNFIEQNRSGFQEMLFGKEALDHE